ncbi:hypothetical protein TIFTF001_016438 [Ficus carica]|uniref:Uncharacterized protein n=1 Tax=Ficus carica TaxID=3494 RepID=A0AA88DIU6_FICCA|nr:hypothetical protein TIFTF001_016438 [Ficus carica]
MPSILFHCKGGTKYPFLLRESHEIQNYLDVHELVISFYWVRKTLKLRRLHPPESLVQALPGVQGYPVVEFRLREAFSSIGLSAHVADSFLPVVVAIVVATWLQHLQELALADSNWLVCVYAPSYDSL